jgi:hypothetical protein
MIRLNFLNISTFLQADFAAFKSLAERHICVYQKDDDDDEDNNNNNNNNNNNLVMIIVIMMM